MLRLPRNENRVKTQFEGRNSIRWIMSFAAEELIFRRLTPILRVHPSRLSSRLFLTAYYVLKHPGKSINLSTFADTTKYDTKERIYRKYVLRFNLNRLYSLKILHSSNIWYGNKRSSLNEFLLLVFLAFTNSELRKIFDLSPLRKFPKNCSGPS